STAGSTRTQDVQYEHVFEMDTKAAAITQGMADRVRFVMKIHHDVFNVEASEVLGDVTDKRLSQYGQRGFCPIGGQRPEPLTETCRQNHPFHRAFILNDAPICCMAADNRFEAASITVVSYPRPLKANESGDQCQQTNSCRFLSRS